MAIDPRTGAAPLRGGDDMSDEPTISAPTVGPAPARSEGRPPAPPTAASASPRAATAAPSRARPRFEARQVQRIITRVEPWSVLKVSLLFALSTWLILVVAGVVLWRVAITTDTISKFENFMGDILGETSWVVDGMQIFRASVIGAFVLAITGMVLAVVFSVLFNLIAGLVGGLRVSVIELETARPTGDRPGEQ